MPTLVLLTDDERLADPARALAVLPRGSLVIVRSRSRTRRVALAALVSRAAGERGLAWIVADDVNLAATAGAQGAHFPERSIALAALWRARRPQWFITCAVHSLRSCLRARRAGANAVLLAPVFATASHPMKPLLGSLRIRLIARTVPVPIYALGGIDSHTARRLSGAPLAGLAVIAGLDPGRNAGTARCASGTTTV
ncbi:MAG: thiamine phosphate synthase [Rhizomicrobium sp.]